jgi:uncharacterized membrane protein
MIEDTWHLLTLVAAIGAGLNGGVFFAFSSFVMPAIDRLPASQSVRTMQSINREAPQPPFMALFLGTALVCAVLGVAALTRLDAVASKYQLAGAVAYLLAIVLTAAYHIPRNNALDQVDPSAADVDSVWRRYSTQWTRGNHLRTLVCAAGAVLLTLAFRAQ